MSLIANSNRTGVALPNEALFNGRGTSGIATVMLPESYSATGVGGSILTDGATVLSAAGNPTQLSEGFYFHHLMSQISETEYQLNAFISNGPVCDISGDTNLATPILDWIVKYNWKSVNLKKINNGTLGAFLLMENPTPRGNYVKIVEAIVTKEFYDTFYADPGSYYGPLFSEVNTLRLTVGHLRDCKVYIRPTESEELVVEYTNAYTADANNETLWVQDAKGNLVTRIDVSEDGDATGSFRIPLKPFQTYTLTIPGYSFRNYDLTLNDSTQWTIEPTKLQFLGTLEANATFYFKVLANEVATFCMKDYNRGAVEGTYGATLTRLQDGEVTDVVLDQQTYYYQHQSVPLPVSSQIQDYKVVLKGAGRTAVWLDGIPNIFSSRLSWYIRPTLLDNEILLSFPDPTPMNYRGHIPLVGHYMPYTDIPETAKADLESLKAQTANIYTFADTMAKTPTWENGFKDYMSGVLGLERDWTLLAKTGRVAVIDFENDPVIQQGVDAWIENIHRINDGKEHYIAAADEPNLNYPSFEAYRRHFVAFATYVRNHPLSAAAKIKIVAPASSRFDHGTTVDDSRSRKGQYWAEMIIEEYPELVDGIAWHDWTVRGLLNVRQYQTAVEAAYKLSNGGQRKLALEQTNTSGGQSVSLYDQNTEFATVWWASVFINVSRTGKLDDLMWFPIADELDHPKGLFSVDESTGTFSFKLVGLFHKWLMSYLHGATNSRVFEMAQPHIEIDVVNWKDTSEGIERDMTLGVNKSTRSYTINFANNEFAEGGVYIEGFNPDGTYSAIVPTYVGNFMKIVIPANTVFIIKRQLVEVETTSTTFDFVNNAYTYNGNTTILSEISEFIRLSTATNWHNEQLVEVASNIPRISSDGLLIEPQRTNLFTNSVMTGGTGVVTTTMEIGAGFMVPAVRFPNGRMTYSFFSVLKPNPGVISAYVKTSDSLAPVFAGSITGAGSDCAFVINGEGHDGTYTVTKHADVYRVSSVTTQAQAQGMAGIGKFATNSAKDVTATLRQIEAGNKLSSLIVSAGSPATRAKETLVVPFAEGQTVTADKDAGVTMTIVDNTAVFEGHGYIRSIEVS